MKINYLIKTLAVLLCFAGSVAFGQSADNPQTVKYPVGAYTPKGDFGAYLEGVTVGLYLVPGSAPNNEGSGTLYNEVDLQVKVWTDPVKKYKYNGKTYTDLCATSFKGYSKVKIQVAIAGVGTKTITIADNDAIDFPLNRLYKDEELNQIKVTSFKLIEMLPKESERKDVAHCVGKQSKQAAKNDNASGSNGAGDKADDAEQSSSSESSQTSGSSTERGSAANQPRQQGNHAENIRKYNAINRDIANVDKAHNEFNNVVDQVSSGMAEKTRAEQQRSKDWWENEKADAAKENEWKKDWQRKVAQNKEAYESLSKEEKMEKAETAEKRRQELAYKKPELIQTALAEGNFDKNGLKEVEYSGYVNGVNRSYKGFIDSMGNEVIPIIYQTAHYLNEYSKEYIKVQLYNGRWVCGLYDVKGKLILPLEYEEDDDWGDAPFNKDGFMLGLLAVKKNGKWGYVNKSGEVVIPFKYDKAFSFRQSQKSAIRKKGKSTYISNAAYVWIGHDNFYINTRGERISN